MLRSRGVGPGWQFLWWWCVGSVFSVCVRLRDRLGLPLFWGGHSVVQPSHLFSRWIDSPARPHAFEQTQSKRSVLCSCCWSIKQTLCVAFANCVSSSHFSVRLVWKGGLLSCWCDWSFIRMPFWWTDQVFTQWDLSTPTHPGRRSGGVDHGVTISMMMMCWFCFLSLCETERSIGSTSVLGRSLSCSTISSLFQMDRFTCSTPCLWADTIKKKCALLLLLINQANTLCGVRQLCEYGVLFPLARLSRLECCNPETEWVNQI